MGKRMRDKSWDDYGISRNRYQELKAFCLQYEEKMSKISRGSGGMNYDGMPHGSGDGKPLERQAIRNVMYRQDCEMIEQAAMKANKAIYPYMMKSVTNDLPYEYIEYDEKYGRIPIGKTDFYSYRRLFYHYLDELKSGDKIDLLS